MVKISIISLIYKSKKYADFIYESVNKYTPMIRTGHAEFFFVANDATEELIEHLVKRGYKFIINNNEKRTPEELFNSGYGEPEYMQYVYKGYNKGITSASGDIVVLVNSDNCFSPDWLENLLKYLGPDSIITSHLVERNHPEHGIFPDASYCDFGNSPKNFDETGFLKFVEQKKVTGLTKGGAYMPCAVFKKNAIKVGLYPEGNLAGKSFKDVVEFGDQNFYRKLSNIGVQHFTSLDSIVYHFKEGEKDEDVPIVENSIPLKRYYKQPNYFPLKSIKIQNLDNYEFLTVDNTPIFFKIMKNNFISLKNFFNSAIIKMKNF